MFGRGFCVFMWRKPRQIALRSLCATLLCEAPALQPIRSMESASSPPRGLSDFPSHSACASLSTARCGAHRCSDISCSAATAATMQAAAQ